MSEPDRPTARLGRDDGVMAFVRSPAFALVVALGGGGALGLGGAASASTLSKKLDENAATTGKTLDEIQKTVQSVESDLRLFKAGDADRRAHEADYEARLRSIERTITEYGVQLRDARKDRDK